MHAADVPALLELDSNRIFHATGACDMQLFTLRTPTRYLLILVDGPVILYEQVGCEHLAVGLPTIDDIRPSEGLDLIRSGGDVEAAVHRFAVEIAGTLRSFDPTLDRLAIGRFPWQAVDALRAQGLWTTDANAVLNPARAIGLACELPCLREAMRRFEAAVQRLEQNAEPDRSETEVWARFDCGLMAKDRSPESANCEDQFLIHEDGVERMSRYPFDDRLQPQEF